MSELLILLTAALFLASVLAILMVLTQDEDDWFD